ncbi:MAG: GWxTD domain-containing protein [Melioribacteraceae bacterium]|nr:GWxTD domain-containing protein [Melioribacteraceae bacterium]MDD3557266.1 GWxTD domain-containing protein [Melioribacteraceae bacterium]
MKKIIWLLVISVNIIFSQSMFRGDYDYAVFPFDDQTGIVEVYYSFSQLGYEPKIINNKKIIEGILQIKIFDSLNSNIVVKRDWEFQSKLDSNNFNNYLTGLLRFQIELGDYSCQIIAADKNNQNANESIEFDFSIKGIDPNRFSISDIQVASSLVQNSKNKESMFYKNTLEIVPNPSSTFGKDLPAIFFYSEIHNVNVNIESQKLKIEHHLINSSNKIVYNKSKLVNRINPSIVDVGVIPVNKYPTGYYTLIVTAADTVMNLSTKSYKQIYVYNPDIIDSTSQQLANVNLLASELATLTVEELDELFDQSKYVASRKEVSDWEKLTTAEAKSTFIYNFWEKRDDTPGTPENEAKDDYFNRVLYANHNFANLMQKKGWKTDFGRIYVTYGKPYEIERYPNELNTKPYEIWVYDSIQGEGNIIFVFADLNGFGEYRLIHSNKTGELSNDDWYNLISGT